MNKEVSIKCPLCSKTVEVATQVQTTFVNPSFFCKTKGCKGKGRLAWVRTGKSSGEVKLTKE